MSYNIQTWYLIPIFFNPRRSEGTVVKFFTFVAGDGFIGIWFTVEGDNAGILRAGWFKDKVKGKCGAAVALETSDPCGWPKCYLGADAVSEVGLGGAEVRKRPIFLVVEFIPYKAAVI